MVSRALSDDFTECKMYGVLQSELNTKMPSQVNLMVEKWLERLLSTCTASASHHLLVIITELVKLHRKFRCFLHQSMTKARRT